MRGFVRFLLGNDLQVASGLAPTTTVLDWLRLNQRRTGTKEGCAEGDCGACTVVIGRLDGETLRYEAINACIRPLVSLDGCQILTVEHLKSPDGALHPVQQAMVDLHGSQCGFCTPGFVMSLYAMYIEAAPANVLQIEDALAGNLCRCTGYRPIIDAAMNTLGERGAVDMTSRSETARRLLALRADETIVIEHASGACHAPASCDALADLLDVHPEATIVAGATDAGLRITKALEHFPVMVDLNRIKELKHVAETKDALIFGAMVDLNRVRRALGAMHPHLDELMRRFGSEQIRNSGTIGGNLANGSPIGDLPPVLIALDAALVLRSKAGRRELPLERFFLDYRKQDRLPGEFVEQIIVPKLPADALLHVSKISKRFDEDISSVCGAFRILLDAGGCVADARLAFGGMAGVPKRAANAEAALKGARWSMEAAVAAAGALSLDFTPLTDMRASARYRTSVAANLLRRFALETLSPHIATRVSGGLRTLADA